jgi:hypothetical protein
MRAVTFDVLASTMASMGRCLDSVTDTVNAITPLPSVHVIAIGVDWLVTLRLVSSIVTIKANAWKMACASAIRESGDYFFVDHFLFA